MKVVIRIEGQISGNGRLLRYLGDSAVSFKSTIFGGRVLFYDRKADAVRDIRSVYKNLLRDEPGFKHGISVNSERTALYYDASSAVIERVID